MLHFLGLFGQIQEGSADHQLHRWSSPDLQTISLAIANLVVSHVILELFPLIAFIDVKNIFIKECRNRLVSVTNSVLLSRFIEYCAVAS